MRLAGIVGAVALVVGFVALFQRGLAGLFDFSYTVVTLVGALALVQGARYGLARRGLERPEVDLGEPETRYEVEVPGDDVDERLLRTGGLTHRSTERRERLRGRLREAAVETVAAREGLSTRRAARRIDDGDWTDDPVARAFLSEAHSYPLSVPFRARLSGATTFTFALARAVDAIERVEEGDA